MNPLVVVLVPAALAGGAPPGEAVMRSCALDARVAAQVHEHVAARYGAAGRIHNLSEARPEQAVVRVTLVSVTTPRGFMFSTGMALTIRGEVLREGSATGSHSLSRQSFAGGETCEVMDRLAAQLARDLAAALPAGLADKPEPKAAK
jgi:hypothetical protein